MIGVNDYCFGVETAQLSMANWFRGLSASGPLEEPRIGLGVEGTGHDNVFPLPISEIANAQPAQIQQDRIAEFGRLARQQVVWIEQGNNQSTPLRNGIAKTDQQVLVGCAAKGLNVQSAGQFGRQPAGGVELKRCSWNATQTRRGDPPFRSLKHRLPDTAIAAEAARANVYALRRSGRP